MAPISLEEGQLSYHIKGNLGWSHFALFIIVLYSEQSEMFYAFAKVIFQKVQLSTY